MTIIKKGFEIILKYIKYAIIAAILQCKPPSLVLHKIFKQIKFDFGKKSNLTIFVSFFFEFLLS